MKSKILKLNKFFLPVSVAQWKEVVKNIFTDAVYPLDITYASNDDGSVIFDELEYFETIKSWEEWMKLPVRPYDEYINSATRSMRLPTVVICSIYEKIRFKKAIFPTKNNIWERDRNICAYSGKVLTRSERSVDHIIPKSRCKEFGIEPDTWENLVTCSREINNKKGDRTLDEFGMRLKYKPYRPKLGWTLPALRDEWKPFLMKSSETS